MSYPKNSVRAPFDDEAVPDFHQITSDLFVWHGYNPECKTDCTSTAFGRRTGLS